jgi:predicted phage baseplate assembly protein
VHDLRQLELPGRHIPLFPPAQPVPGDAFYLALEQDHSRHVLAMVLECETAGGAGVDPTNPPVVWEAWQGGLARWVQCEVEYDSTGGFNQSGEIILHLPDMVEDELQGTRAYWLRCRLTDEQGNPANAYRVSPDLERLEVEARGGIAGARHAVTVTHELLGRSDGTPGQTFKLLYTPILARDPARDYLIVEVPGEAAQEWHEVSDFAASGPEDRHFTLDSLDGTLKLGPALIQPDGTMYRFGAVPPHGATLRFSRYQYGGGIIGNVPRGTLAVMKTAIPYVARVSNRAAAVGGRNEQSLEDAKLRAAQVLRSQTRAVTADDYEHLAAQVPHVARAYCLAPGVQPSGPSDLQPGQVVVLVLPELHTPNGRIVPEQLALSAELRTAVMAHLADRSVIGTRLEVREPRFIWVSVVARLRRPEGSDPQQTEAIQHQVEAALYRYLNPYTGGPDGTGWPLGRDLHVSELYGLLQQLPAIDFVEEVRLSIGDPGSGVPAAHNAPRLTVPHDTIICSGQHQVQLG